MGDTVIITAGKDKGKTGKVLRVLPEKDAVVVQGMNMYTRSLKPMAGRPGERKRQERALKAANVAILNPDTNKPDRVGYVVDKDGTKQRVYKKTGKLIATK